MKTNIYIQYREYEFQEKPIINRIKELWSAKGNRIKDIETLNLYIKPEENKVYYVINNTISGSLPINE